MSKAFDEIFFVLPEKLQLSLHSLFNTIHFTESQKLEIVKDEMDLHEWKEKSFVLNENIEEYNSRKDGRKGEEYLKKLRLYIDSLRYSETDYSNFEAQREPKIMGAPIMEERKIVLSRCPCPVDGEKTRCCKLRTLDAVMLCGFDCAYCSVRSFYGKEHIRVVSNLKEQLENIEVPEDVWHIGTGQASDSLALGDEGGTLSALSSFASKHPNVIIELKSKSKRNVFNTKYPKNMIFTWSLNAPTIVEKEEHLTSSLIERLENAERARDNGNKVGFHIHPMVYFKGWEEEYKTIVDEIERRFIPSDITHISIGTLTFTKNNLKELRKENQPSRVLEMPLTEAAGKYSYPLDIKEKMFSFVYSSFSKEFRENIFFYLCMEDPVLWMRTLGREYKTDKEFEMDMKKHYFDKLN